jgi:hypothetical protein
MGSMVDPEPTKLSGRLSRFPQPAFFGAMLGLLLWLVAPQVASQPIHGGSSGTPTASARPRLTRACTPEELAFSGAIKDCALPVGPIGTCTVNGNATPCGLPSGHPIPCSGLGNSPSSSFGVSLTLLGATQSIYELSVDVTHGYNGAGTYPISPSGNQVTPQPAPAVSITVADSLSHQFWTATSGTVTITGAGTSGTVSAILHASDGSTASPIPQTALLDGPWACG